MKKTILLLTICLLAINTSATAQTQKQDNSERDWAIEPQFDDARSFSEGLACVEQNGKWGFIDKTGKWVIQPKFDATWNFSEGLARARQNGKYGFIDKTGKWMIQPLFDLGVTDFSEGLACAKQNGKYGFIDKTGKWVIEPKFYVAWDFSEGLARAYDYKVGFMDKTGKWMIQPLFDYGVSDFSEGLAYAKQNGKYGFIDKTGKWVIQPKFDAVWDFSEGLARATQNDKYGFIDKTGTWVIQPQFDGIDNFSDGLARATQNDKWGFIDKTGKWVIQPQFDDVESFFEGLAKAAQNGKYGFIDKTGKWIIPPQFDYDTGDFSEGLARVKHNGKWGFVEINKSGFREYAINYIEPRINEWQKKGEFEKTADWQQRVNETTRNQMIDQLTKEAEQSYLNSIAAETTLALSLGEYDADNETFLIKENSRFKQNMLVHVPVSEAKYFKDSWKNIQHIPQYSINDNKAALAEVTFKLPSGESYTYSNQTSLNYTTAKIDYNFDPIKIELADSEESKQGNQNISTVDVNIGKSDVDLAIPETRIKNDKTFAVIIANENYKRESQVEFALNDGKMFREYCIKTLGIPENHIHYETDATLNGIRSEINWLNKTANAYSGEANLIFYYAGHGIPDEASKTAYLLPADGYGSDIQSGYKLDDLYAALGEAQARSVTVFLDACFSGAKRDGTMLASARGISINVKQGVPTGNMIVFTAATNDETAYPYREKGHGMFTYFLLKKLQESKGNVTLGELGDYIATNVKRQSIVVNNKSQTPTVIPSPALSGGWENRKLYQ